MAGLPANDSGSQSTQKLNQNLKLGGLKAPRRAGKTLFARKGEASPLVDKKGGAEAPEEVVVETRASRLREVEGGFDTTLQIINERSAEAGYPDNPTSEEIETQYFDVADIYSSGETTAREALGESSAAPADRVAPTADGAARAPAAPVSLPISETVSGAMTAAPQAATAPTPQAPVSMPTPRASGRRARISIQMTAAEYLRLKLGAAVLGFDEADLINTALTEYLDNWGVDSLDDCAKLKGAVELFESAGGNDD